MTYLEVFDHDDLVCRIFYDLKKRKISFENYSQNIYALPFGRKTEATFKDFEYFLGERCFPKERANCKELLRSLGLSHYNPYDIVKITHGVMYSDYIWLRFEGERLCYNDIKIRD